MSSGFLVSAEAAGLGVGGGKERRALQGLAWEGRKDKCQGRREGEKMVRFTSW